MKRRCCHSTDTKSRARHSKQKVNRVGGPTNFFKWGSRARNEGAYPAYPLPDAPTLANVEGAPVARAVISGALEPLYDIDPRTGTSIQVFYADRVLAQSFGTSGPGWFWWTCRPECLPDVLTVGPFANSYLAYAAARRDSASNASDCFQMRYRRHKCPHPALRVRT